ncbi:hypothetical protein O7A70_06295 [Mesorhizobium sp. Cs1299R1N1]|uniref:hypothetical protein n=1 Tax=Mesorhizobium sp. Cs1299R1N1 TaxID=3015172 RepID=UPI00301BE69F
MFGRRTNIAQKPKRFREATYKTIAPEESRIDHSDVIGPDMDVAKRGLASSSLIIEALQRVLAVVLPRVKTAEAPAADANFVVMTAVAA